jgi:hypothetical protein
MVVAFQAGCAEIQDCNTELPNLKVIPLTIEPRLSKFE